MMLRPPGYLRCTAAADGCVVLRLICGRYGASRAAHDYDESVLVRDVCLMRRYMTWVSSGNLRSETCRDALSVGRRCLSKLRPSLHEGACT